MSKTVKSVKNHISRNRIKYAVAAVATTAAAVAVQTRVEDWSEFFTNPETFDAKYPA